MHVGVELTDQGIKEPEMFNRRKQYLCGDAW